MADGNIARDWLRRKRPRHARGRRKHLYLIPKGNIFVCYDDANADALAFHQDNKRRRDVRPGEAKSRFLSAFHRQTDQCSFVVGARPGMPASVVHGYTLMPAARYACILAHGLPKDESLVARHLCGNGHLSCVNPRHLAWGTYEDNTNDAALHHQKPVFWPPRLTKELADEIRHDKRLVNIIAISTGIHAALIRLIKDGRGPFD